MPTDPIEAQIAAVERAAELSLLDERNLRSKLGHVPAAQDAADKCLAHANTLRAVIDTLRQAQTMREALEIIAGRRQCLDNLMSHVEIAHAALSPPVESAEGEA